MGRKSFVSKAEEESDYEYQKYLEKKREMETELSLLSKFNVAYVPVENEPLSMYVERLDPIVHQLDLQLQMHYNWYTHKRSPNCPICDSINVSQYILKIMTDISKEEPNKWKAKKLMDGIGNLSFFFTKKRL